MQQCCRPVGGTAGEAGSSGGANHSFLFRGNVTPFDLGSCTVQECRHGVVSFSVQDIIRQGKDGPARVPVLRLVDLPLVGEVKVHLRHLRQHGAQQTAAWQVELLTHVGLAGPVYKLPRSLLSLLQQLKHLVEERPAVIRWGWLSQENPCVGKGGGHVDGAANGCHGFHSLCCAAHRQGIGCRKCLPGLHLLKHFFQQHLPQAGADARHG
mmetsp:Transcript_34863/g.98835  ORF Transcript_34863/g.98835 Transcript_34863/m.98835 type:complete len:210 (-) Transcript_34863:1944-2573(-)